jgi:hypothetical protein
MDEHRNKVAEAVRTMLSPSSRAPYAETANLIAESICKAEGVQKCVELISMEAGVDHCVGDSCLA